MRSNAWIEQFDLLLNELDADEKELPNWEYLEVLDHMYAEIGIRLVTSREELNDA